MNPEETDPLTRDLLQSLPPGPAPDAARLAATRAAGLAAFAEIVPTTPKRTKPMTHLLRLAGGLLAASLALFALIQDRAPEPPPEVTRHFRLTEEGRTLDVYRRGTVARIEDGPEQYTLLPHEGDAYAVDESANRYTPLPAGERERLRELVYGDSESPDTEVRRDGAGGLVELRRYALNNGVRTLVATLTLVGNAPPMPDDAFALTNTLSEDGRVGKVTAVQGLAGLKPVNAARFTPLRADTLLMPGDLLRVDLRGANAITARLLPDATLIAGPGAMVEVAKPTRLRLTQGEIELTPAKGTPIELTGPGDAKLTVTERGIYRVTGDKLAPVAIEPVWLKSLKGASVNESLGSLVAQVDGRAVPLTVGIHKVTVEIRDQIARTTVEETFVNNTDSLLEGVFQFPLPADASIAGFAMWIGNEKVEADVVEKQRAREIYETILREKRDPGLLEWQGGNLFKARVYPIFAHSEKRVSITYTQVLPALGGKVRYSYALQSEMLRLHPLKELSVTLTVASALPLKSVKSPTHPCRESFTPHAARLEFAAQEYTPTKDFEAAIELADAAPPVTVIPHRRGSDGYFLLEVTPPAPPQSGRELVADTKPIALTLWCDTSASIDAADRRARAAMVAALLSALTPADTFDLAVTDIQTQFAFDKPVPATPENVVKARDFLAGRASLGWTDLTRGLTAVLARAAPGSTVVYLGDGVAGTLDANPQAAATRLDAAYRLAAKPVTVHAVALGSKFESGVLAKLASFGPGSWRRVNAEQGPTAVALDILNDVTRPPVRNVKVAFTGVKTAKVYPEVLPNLTPGTQQIVLGRYLPTGDDQKGDVVVTGTLDGQEVRYSAPVTLKDAEAGNSFLPRLWARHHLDALLEQPRTPTVKDDVIALSEEFHIITPYTSFLVLETDADRARFGVKRRFEMRDGEQFFADGRDQAGYALKREQMKLAGLWRADLRRRVLGRLDDLERTWTGQSAKLLILRKSLEYNRSAVSFGGALPALNSPIGGVYHYRSINFANRDKLMAYSHDAADLLNQSEDYRAIQDESASSGPSRLPGFAPPPTAGFPELADAPSNESGQLFNQEEREVRDDDNDLFAKDSLYDSKQSGLGRGVELHYLGSYDVAGIGLRLNPGYKQRGGFARVAAPSPPAVSPLDALFPYLPPVPSDEVAKSPWPKDVTELAASIYRRPALAKLSGGVTITESWQGFNSRQATAKNSTTELFSAKRWATRRATDSTATQLDWCDGQSRFSVNEAYHLARRRDAKPADLAFPPLSGGDASMSPLWTQYGGDAKLDKSGPTPVIVVTSADGRSVIRISVDAGKKVVTKLEVTYDGKLTRATTYADFVQARGLWWATAVETTSDGKVTTRVTRTVAETGDDAFAKAFAALTAPLAKCIVRKQPYPTVAVAKRALAENRATVDDRLTLLRQAFAYGRPDEANAEFDAIAKLEAGKPALTWARLALLMATRRNEQARQLMLASAKEVMALPSLGDRIAVAQWLTQRAGQILSYPEQIELRDRFTPLFAALPVNHGSRRDWVTLYYYALINAGRGVEAFDYLKAHVAEDPASFDLRILYLRLEFARGERDAAIADLRGQIAVKEKWTKFEIGQYYSALAEFQEQLSELPAKRDTLKAWLAFDPESEPAAEQLLSALVRTDAVDEAEALAKAWIVAAKVVSPTPEQVAKARAGIRVVTGQDDKLRLEHIAPKWLPILTEAARVYFTQEPRFNLREAVTNNAHYLQTDEFRALASDLFDAVLNTARERSPQRLSADLAWLSNNPGTIGRDRWVKLVAAAKARWANIADEEAKHELGATLGTVITNHLGVEEAVIFTRERIQSGPAKYRLEYRSHLFWQLQQLPWNPARVAELYDMLPLFLTGADGKPVPATLAVHELMALDNWAFAARNQSLQAEIKHPERLTRPELQAKRDEVTRAARGEVIDRLSKFEATAPAALKPWVTLERLTFQARQKLDPNAIAAGLFALVGDKPAVAPDPESEVELTPEHALSLELQDRAVSLLMHAATRKAATKATVAKLMALLDAGMKQEPKDADWKRAKFELLVAFDRPKELETELTAWAKDDPTALWRTSLGYLLAELGRLKEAIATFAGIKEIGPTAFAREMALSRLYMAVDDKPKHDATRVTAYKQLREDQLAQLLYAKYYPWQPRQGVALPTELDPDTLPILAALVEKTTSIQNYLNTTRLLYLASKDFRIPATIADAVLGQTAEKIYAVLTGMQPMLGDIRDEAAADSGRARVEALRPKAKSPTDSRALDLIEMQIERRAAEVRNQPGPHAARALAAFRRAFDRPWADGERLMMARLLREFGRVTPDSLRAEQLRELKALTEGASKGSLERLEIADCYAAILHVGGQPIEAITVLRPALAETIAATKGVFTNEMLPAASELAGFHKSLKDYAAAEKLWLGWREVAANQPLKVTITQNLDRLYVDAFRYDAEVTLGSGTTLYEAILKRLGERLADRDPNARTQTIGDYGSLFDIAASKKYARVKADVLALANETFPKIARPWDDRHADQVIAVADQVRRYADFSDAIAFIVGCVEALPSWLRASRSEGWDRYAQAVASYRHNQKDLPPGLDARLLKLVLADLREDLRTRGGNYRAMTHARHAYYWAAKEPEFAATAEAVIAENKASTRTVLFVADYLYQSCNRAGRAIDVLYDLKRDDRLDVAGRGTLSRYLVEQNRFAEAVEILVPLIQESPDDLTPRFRLMTAYYRLGKPTQLRELFSSSVARWKGRDLWDVNTIASFAANAQDCDMHREAADLYAELIPNVQRATATPNGTLAEYYRRYALSLSKLGKPVEAIDAAGGAIVAWGNDLRQRQQAIDALNAIVRQAGDLAPIVAHFDQETAKTGLLNPIVREAIGKAYRDRENYAPSIAQLELAIEGQPNDPETFNLLIDSYDKANRKGDAIARILQLLDLSRRDLGRYDELGKRYAASGDAANAERAFTSVVEVTRGDAEGLVLLANVRERQDHWADAIPLWEQANATRPLEPEGLLGLAAARIHLKRFEPARETLRKLLAKEWPTRNDVRQKVAELESKIGK